MRGDRIEAIGLALRRTDGILCRACGKYSVFDYED
jgi:hypothetical protein